MITARRHAPAGHSSNEISVICEDEWLRLDQPLTCELRSPRALLSMNADLPGIEKVCYDNLGQPVLRVELPHEGGDVEARISQVRSAAQRAMDKIGRTHDPAPTTGDEGPIPDVPALCAEAGWRCIQRAPANWVVELPDMPSFCQAEISIASGAISVSVPMGSEQANPAIDHLLSRACGAFRMVRAAGPPYRLLVRIPFDHVAANFPHALAAINVGARALIREVAALRDPALARTYQELQPFAPLTGAPTQSNPIESEMDQGENHAHRSK
jgi:hypothetical protein